MAKVSVIIPVYNGEKYIRQAIDSVLRQKYHDFEIIVIDDGSIDGTTGILSEYGNQIRWKIQQHKGQASAINAGLKLAQGVYITYLDSDDRFLPDKIATQARYLDEHPEADVVYGDLDCVDKTGKYLHTGKSKLINQLLLKQRCFVPRTTVMNRKSCFETVGFFDETITGSDDWDMWVRMSEECAMVYINQSFAIYRQYPESTSNSRKNKLNHYRWTKSIILKKACERQGRPLWLRIMVLNSVVQQTFGRIWFYGERFPRVWSGIDKISWFILEPHLRHLKRSSERSLKPKQ